MTGSYWTHGSGRAFSRLIANDDENGASRSVVPEPSRNGGLGSIPNSAPGRAGQSNGCPARRGLTFR